MCVCNGQVFWNFQVFFWLSPVCFKFHLILSFRFTTPSAEQNFWFFLYKIKLNVDVEFLYFLFFFNNLNAEKYKIHIFTCIFVCAETWEPNHSKVRLCLKVFKSSVALQKLKILRNRNRTHIACLKSESKNRQKSRIMFVFLFVHRCLNGFYSFLFWFVLFLFCSLPFSVYCIKSFRLNGASCVCVTLFVFSVHSLK